MIPAPTRPSLRHRGRSLAVVGIAAALGAVVGGCGLFGTDLGVDGVDSKWIGVDGQDGREALVVAPEDHFTGSSGAEDLPVVVVLHGLGGTAEEMATMAEWPEAARDNDFLAVFPEGVSDSWNAGDCCGRAMEWNTDDVAYLDALFLQLAVEEGVDPERIYLTGYSNGAMLTHLYACQKPDVLAGAASVAGTNFSDCRPEGSVDFMQVSGSEDPVIPVLGGESSLETVGEVPSVEESMLALAGAAGCVEPKGFELAGVVSFHGDDCSSGHRIRYDVVQGLGHEYPNSENSPEYVAVDKILEFWGLDRVV